MPKVVREHILSFGKKKSIIRIVKPYWWEFWLWGKRFLKKPKI